MQVAQGYIKKVQLGLQLVVGQSPTTLHFVIL